MKAYELNATVTADGHIELPDFQLSFPSERPKTVKIIILVAEPDEKNNGIANLDECVDEQRLEAARQLQGLFKELQVLPSSLVLTEEEIAEEVDAYRRGE